MLRKIVYVIGFAVFTFLLVVACSAQETPQKNPDRIDAYSLLQELEKKLEKTPETKKECEVLLQDIRIWQETKLEELKRQQLRTPKYGFECQWKPQDYNDSQACTQVFFSDEFSYEGRCSLKMMIDLIEGDKHKSKGEAWVNMLAHPPIGESVPVDLDGHTVSARIYAPSGARWKPNKPNGMQLFVKDDKGNSQYGPWHNITERQWFKISLKVSDFKPSDGLMDSGFNPSRIAAVGVKIGTGEGSKATYKGPIFVDGVNWE